MKIRMVYLIAAVPSWALALWLLSMGQITIASMLFGATAIGFLWMW